MPRAGRAGGGGAVAAISAQCVHVGPDGGVQLRGDVVLSKHYM